MMGRSLVLEDFDRVVLPTASEAEGGEAKEADLEQARLQAFENGYGAGWEDAARAHREEQDQISAELGRALQEMSFTFHEAQTALLREMESVLVGLVDTVLPAALLPSLAEMVRSRALELAGAGHTCVEIVVVPENVARVEALAADRPAPPLRVVGEPALGPGQALLRFGRSEEKIDLDAALSDLREAVAGFAADAPASMTEQPAQEAAESEDEEKEMRHG